MIEAREDPRFLLEAGEHPRGPGHVGAEHLGGEAPVQVGVPELVHFGEAPAPEEPLHLVGGAERRGEPRRHRHLLLGRGPLGAQDRRPLGTALGTADLGHAGLRIVIFRIYTAAARSAFQRTIFRTRICRIRGVPPRHP